MSTPTRDGVLVALVTGAARGIGLAIADHLAKNGYAVAALDIVPRNVPIPPGVHSYHCDVSDGDAVANCVQRIQEDLGSVSVLVNNAGVGGPFHRLDQVSDKEWEWIFGTNVRSILNFGRLLLPAMRDRSFGRIINVASIQGLLGASCSSTYVASKHAVVGYTKAIAAEWGPFGVTANAICPGYVETAQGAQEGVPNHLANIVRRTPVRRLAAAEEIAQWALILASPLAGYVNGSVITVDGGISADVGVS